jgi:hypothetical protein
VVAAALSIAKIVQDCQHCQDCQKSPKLILFTALNLDFQSKLLSPLVLNLDSLAITNFGNC